VYVEHDGTCRWTPSFRWSVSHCSMDSTWFPFDEQYCDLIYESWRYSAAKVNLTAFLIDHGTHQHPVVYPGFQPNDQWEVIGRFFTARCYASAVLAMGLCPCLSVSVTSRCSTKIRPGSPPTRAPNAGGVVKIGDFRQIMGCISKTVKDRHIVSIKVE